MCRVSNTRQHPSPPRRSGCLAVPTVTTLDRSVSVLDVRTGFAVSGLVVVPLECLEPWATPARTGELTAPEPRTASTTTVVR